MTEELRNLFRKNMAANGRLIIVLMAAIGLHQDLPLFAALALVITCLAYVSDVYGITDRPKSTVIVSTTSAALTLIGVVGLFIAILF